MRRTFAVVAFISVVASPVVARDLTITLTEQEAQAVIQVLDLGVKAGGLSAAEAALMMLHKLQDAAATLPTPATSDPTPETEK